MSSPPPTIGILCIDTANILSKLYNADVKSYIAASYVKFVECAGAQAVPIWIGMSEQYYNYIMQKINGIILPGGQVFFNSEYIKTPGQTNECVRSIEIIFRTAKEMNDRNVYFPVLGICLGFELLLNHSANGQEVRQDCSKLNKSMVLELDDDYKSSKMFNHLSADMESILQTEPFAFHSHQYCITKADLHLFNIADQWRVTSVNRDDNNLEFISTCEHTKYPIYGLQFHPEKVIFERNSVDNISHTGNSVKCAQFMANFFVSECRKNSNQFSTYEDACRHFIHRFPVTFTGTNTKWLQCYLFYDPPSDTGY